MNYTAIVEGMSCQGCANAVKAAFTQVKGVEKVDVKLDAKEVTVTSQVGLSEAELSQALEDTSYSLISLN